MYFRGQLKPIHTMKINFTRILLLLFLSAPMIVKAQNSAASDGRGDNMAKFNVLALVSGKFAFEYERRLTDRISLGAGVSFRPDKGVPFRSMVESFVDDEDLEDLVNDLTTSNFSFTPELRFYMNDRGTFNGLYVAPYLKYTNYGAGFPFDFDVNVEYEGNEVYSRTETIPLDADFSSFTAGVALGINFELTDNLYLDWRIIGPGFGFAGGDISGSTTLNAEEQASLRESLEDLRTDLSDLPLSIKIDYDVRSDGADIDVKRSPWADIRSGLSIAYRF
jgi:hypothetical protein